MTRTHGRLRVVVSFEGREKGNSCRNVLKNREVNMDCSSVVGGRLSNVRESRGQEQRYGTRENTNTHSLSLSIYLSLSISIYLYPSLSIYPSHSSPLNAPASMSMEESTAVQRTERHETHSTVSAAITCQPWRAHSSGDRKAGFPNHVVT